MTWILIIFYTILKYLNKIPFFLYAVFLISLFFHSFNFFIEFKYSLINFICVFCSKFYYNNFTFNNLFFISNLDIYFIFNISILLFYFYINTFFLKIIPTNSQIKIESFLYFISQMIYSQNGLKGQKFFIFFIILFLFIFTSNFLGMLPFGFTITSHIFQTFALGAGVIISITILAVSRNSYKWFKFFFPDLPLFILPLFSFIEVISYISRAFSLSIRLFANLMSGHTLLYILTGFIIKIGASGILFFLLL